MPLLSLSNWPGTFMRAVRKVENARRFADAEPFDFQWELREDQFALNRALLENDAYATQTEGGFREDILESLGVPACDVSTARLSGFFAPFRNIVDAYQNVFRGAWGQDIKVADTVDGQPVNPRLIDPNVDPLRKVWAWSNLNTQKQVMQEWAANLGTVGLRIVAKADADPAKRRVSIQIDHPGTIIDFDEDSRGNVSQVLLRYKALSGPLGKQRFDVKVEELFTKEEFIQTVNGKQTIRQKNELGVCPYVILRHRDDGREFGRWAYAGSEQIVHGINWLISNQGESIVEHGWPTWFASAGGKKPERFEFGRKKVAYVQTSPDTPPPSLEPLVAPLNQADAREMWKALIGVLVDRQPELVISSIEALSGQSGETIAKLLIPAEAAIERAKATYEDAVRRAMQIAMSEGIRIGLWDIGTGTGTTDAADRAYGEGLENFEFAPRRPLPDTAYDKVQQAKAQDAAAQSKVDLMTKAGNVEAISRAEVLRLGGYNEADAAKIKREKSQDDVIAAEPDDDDETTDQ